MAKEKRECEAADAELKVLLSQTPRERSDASSKLSGVEVKPGEPDLSIMKASIDLAIDEAVLEDRDFEGGTSTFVDIVVTGQCLKTNWI